MLNSCWHRGMRVYRSDEGKQFLPRLYHAWTYSNTGSLKGMPKYGLGYWGAFGMEDRQERLEAMGSPCMAKNTVAS